jgi:hypothetical protein
MLDLDSAYRLKSDIVLRSIKEKYWALNIKTGNQYKLNEVAYYILKVLNEETTINDLADKVTSEYKVSKKDFINDYNSLINDALTNGIVEEVNLP